MVAITTESFLRRCIYVFAVSAMAAMTLRESPSHHVVAADTVEQRDAINSASSSSSLLRGKERPRRRKLDSAWTRPPTANPTEAPTPEPTPEPTTPPTPPPSSPPTPPPTPAPVPPTPPPTPPPTNPPTPPPTNPPTTPPTDPPTVSPTTEFPTVTATTDTPTTGTPTEYPTTSPTENPTTNNPTSNPTGALTEPTFFPSNFPTSEPTTDPTPEPTKAPTPEPTPAPTPEPTPAPTTKPTLSPRPTVDGATQCGALVTDGTGLPLGPYETVPRTFDTLAPSRFKCNDGEGDWFSKSYYAPSYLYSFKLTQQCHYMYRDPTNPLSTEDTEVRDVNSWFDTAAMKFQRPGHSAMKVSDPTIGFTGYSVPHHTRDLEKTENLNAEDWCPEDYYCVRVRGSAIGTITNNYGDASSFEDRRRHLEDDDSVDHALIYAFSHRDAQYDLHKMLYDAMKSNNKRKIFRTNHFLRCDCDSFCLDDAPDPDHDNQSQATCYVEEVCGERVFKVSYSPEFSQDKKPEWSDTGTTDVMAWFSACAYGQFQCDVHPNSQFDLFEGIDQTSNKKFPNSFRYDTYQGYPEVYGLGGKANHGFPSSTTNQPYILWTCPSEYAKEELRQFGKIIEETKYMRYTRGQSGIPPTKPCEPEIIDPPSEPELPPPIGPDCTDVDHAGYCIQLPGGTCFIREPILNCVELDFVINGAPETINDGVGLITRPATSVYSDVGEWMKACIDTSTDCTLVGGSEGTLTYKGGPRAEARTVSNSFEFELSNLRVNNEDTMENGEIFFECTTWESAYGAKNFTDGAADRYHVFANSYGDLFTVEDTSEHCSEEPTDRPSEAPTLSIQPSSFPTLAPTVCKDSYLDSEKLNIALVVDLSFSTYEKTFSSEIDIGDVNGDGKGNTILDAQIYAIQDLLVSIAASETLNNDNTEIKLISFHTDAMRHPGESEFEANPSSQLGVWAPLNDAGDSYNPTLMDYIKENLRAPLEHETRDLNNGFTNFDAALDRTVEYFQNEATHNRLNLMVFMSDGEPNVRGDGDEEMYCADTLTFWNSDVPDFVYTCADLNLEPGQPHSICLANDNYCVENEPYQDCVRGPNKCFNSDAVQQYTSELNALDVMNVKRLAIGVGDESNVASGSALWMIDDNPGKDQGILPEQVLTLEELSSALKHLCILNTDPPTGEPTKSPSEAPTVSPVPSNNPSQKPSSKPSHVPSSSPTIRIFKFTDNPTTSPSVAPTIGPSASPSSGPSLSPTTSSPSDSPSVAPTPSPSSAPSSAPTPSPSEAPSGSFFPSVAPTEPPTKSVSPSSGPTKAPTTFPTFNPTNFPSIEPTPSPSNNPSTTPTKTPSSTPTISPTTSSAPTFLLPDCYDGPKLVRKDSSDINMCNYNTDMVQINDMNNTDVTIAINNVWTANALPEQLQVFVHSNGVHSIRRNGDGFQCMNNDGHVIDLANSNELSLSCYQEESDVDAPWLAVIDVVITDKSIGDIFVNDVSHPCFDDQPIPESCSWRFVIPCDYEELCTEEPSSTPSVGPSPSPSAGPSPSPTAGPSPSPSDSPTSTPTTKPTGPFSNKPSNQISSEPTDSPVPTFGTSSEPSDSLEPTFGTSSEPSDSLEPTFGTNAPTKSPLLQFKPPPTPSSNDDVFSKPCPEDVLVIKHEGVTPFPSDGIRIMSQDETTVTVELTQTYTTPSTTIEYIFYQHSKDYFNSKCYEEKDIDGDSRVALITIQCMKHTPIALLDLWVADDIGKNVLAAGDNATIPECCHPDVPEGTPVTKYLIEIKCITACPEVFE